jgi:hypothetical protein
MKKLLLFTWLALLLSIATFSQTLDQSQTVVQHFVAGNSFGQSFVAGINGSLSKFSYYYQIYNNPFEDFQLQIYSGAGNTGTLLGTQSFSTTSSTPQAGPLEIPITTPIDVVAGNTYTIYVLNINGTGLNIGYGTNNPYPSGNIYSGNNIFGTGLDFWFQTFVTPVVASTHLNFEGVDDFVELPNTLDSSLANNVTVEFWMKSATTPNQDDALFTKGQSGFGLSLNSDGTVRFSGSGGFQTINSTAVVTDGAWHHIAGTFYSNPSTNASIYIDGVLDGSTTIYQNGQISFNPFPIAIGANSEVSGSHFTGSIEDLRIWSVARTASEITVNKACELTGTETNLEAYYKFNQGNGAQDNTSHTLLTDATANANHGNLNNFAKTGNTSNFLAGSLVTTGDSCNPLSTTSFNLDQTVNLYPNPTNGSVRISLPTKETSKIAVYDINGRLLIQTIKNEENFSLDLSKYSAGIYILKMEIKGREFIRKIIKQ